MFPKTGRKFPVRGRVSKSEYAVLIAEILRQELGNSHQAHKTLMKWTGANERTAKNWLSGSNGPSGEHLLQLVRNSDLVFECLLNLVGRKAVISNRTLAELRNNLLTTTELLSEVIDGQQPPLQH
jgi:hypothetical protein